MGATLVGLAFVLPSFLMVVAISLAYITYGGLWWMQAVFYGIGATVIAIIAIAAYKLARSTNKRDPLLWGIFATLAVVTVWAQAELAEFFVVAGMIVGEFIADFCDRPENDVNIPTGVVHGYLEREQARLDAMCNGRGTESAMDLRVAMQEIMTAKVGIFRRGKDLEQAVEELQTLLVRSRKMIIYFINNRFENS